MELREKILVVEDENGYKSFTNAYFVEELP